MNLNRLHAGQWVGVALALASASGFAAPVLLNDFYTPDSTVYTVLAPGVLANDSSAVGGLRVISINTSGLQGTVSMFADGRFIFSPANGLSSNTGFQYTATDNSGATVTASVLFDMVSTLPVARADSYVPNAVAFNVAAGTGLLVNDGGGIGALRVTSINTSGLLGSVSVFADGHFAYTPATGQTTNTSFSYTLADALGRTTTATVMLDLQSTLPTALADSYTPNATTFNVAAGTGLLINDSGGIGALKVASINTTGLQGSVSVFADGHFAYTPTLGQATNTSFKYTLIDEAGRTTTATVNLDLESTLPVAQQDLYAAFVNETLNLLSGGLLDNDSGGIGQLLVQSINITGLQGTIAAFADGSFRFTPTLGFLGYTSFIYTLVDGLGRTSQALVGLNVLARDPGSPNGVPEPGTLALLGCGLAALAWRARRRPAH